MRWTIAEERTDGRWFAPSAERNHGPILGILKRVLPPRGTVLEIGSGTGQHAAYFARALQDLEWQPTEADAAFLVSIARWTEWAGTANVAPPLNFDVREIPWPIEAADAIVCINVIHVAPWEVVPALFRGASRVLPPAGVLFLYGPYRRQVGATAPSNEAFDAKLRAQDTKWGLHSVEEVAGAGEYSGFSLAETVDMPANNLSLVFRRTVDHSP